MHIDRPLSVVYDPDALYRHLFIRPFQPPFRHQQAAFIVCLILYVPDTGKPHVGDLTGKKIIELGRLCAEKEILVLQHGVLYRIIDLCLTYLIGDDQIFPGKGEMGDHIAIKLVKDITAECYGLALLYLTALHGSGDLFDGEGGAGRRQQR